MIPDIANSWKQILSVKPIVDKIQALTQFLSEALHAYRRSTHVM